MHHVVIDRWSRGTSVIHVRDPRLKLAAALLVIASISVLPASPARFAVVAAALIVMALLARLPVAGIAWRAALVLPFSVAFAAASWASGHPDRAWQLLGRSYLSGATALLLISTTPLRQLLAALEWFRVPPLLVLVIQFLYRYLFVIAGEAQHMRAAALCRAASGWSFRGAAGALSVLFARSYARAEGIQRAMDARGFDGHFPEPWRR